MKTPEQSHDVFLLFASLTLNKQILAGFLLVNNMSNKIVFTRVNCFNYCLFL